MNTPSSPVFDNGTPTPQPRNSRNRAKTVWLALLVLTVCCLLSAAITAWWVKRNIYASPLHPVTLTVAEQQTFDQKVETLKLEGGSQKPSATPGRNIEDEKRTLRITDKEINAFLDKQGLGEQFKVELAHGGAEVTALLPVDEVVPVLGGKTLRLKLGLRGDMSGEGKPAFSISDISLGGVSLPNAWWGNLKGVNLFASTLEADPVVRQFLAGIRELEIDRGSIRVLLNE